MVRYKLYLQAESLDILLDRSYDQLLIDQSISNYQILNIMSRKKFKIFI